VRCPFTEAELATLLDRPVRHLLTAADRRRYAGRRLLITGAGGSVGSELARQLADCAPAALTLVDHSELHLFEIARELAERGPDLAIEPVLADITHEARIARLVGAAAPEVVFHAAAYKHVSMMERDVCAAVATNVLGTANVVAASREAGARFVLISSDKAAAPRSVMGATKRLAEGVVLAESARGARAIVVRFGNILGSSGSLLAIFRDRIRQGLPLSLTDPGATRYLMTAGEAVSLVMKADLLARRPETYWLDMGEPVRIGCLAERLLALEARLGFAAVPVETIGLRPGEKLREELTSQGLRMCPTRHRRIWVARQRPSSGSAVDTTMRALRRAVSRGDAADALALITRTVDDYTPSEDARARAEAQSVHSRRATVLGNTRTA
jgi:FlaA1/EpsC-like NDP-sugar epimerase